VSKAAASAWFGISRQAWYQARKRELEQEAQNALLLELVRAIRSRHPRMGGRKLHHELQKPMADLYIQRGRDRFLALLREHDLLVAPKRTGRRTTRSGLWRCPNLVAGLPVLRVNQVWVADITYILTESGFLYLALITDAFSRFIVGYDLSSSLAAESCLRALQRALRQAGSAELAGLIHHSDHGVQYTSFPYRDRLQEAQIVSSMGEVGNCYENALAERMNGILKCEYGLDDLFVSQPHVLSAVNQAVWLYNHERPHLSLNYQKPAEVYLGKHSF
jgi:transposase InsO family protein